MILILLIFIVIGLATIINHLRDLSDQNEAIIDMLDQLYDRMNENQD